MRLSLSIDKVLNEELKITEKSCRKCAVKASPRPFFDFGK